jgi:hypothetical protein
MFAIGFATSASPIITSAIPHHRKVEITSPRKIKQPSGTRISTTRESGNARVNGTYLSTYSQLMKLMMMRRIAHHTSGDSKPLMPVHENALSGSATSAAPRFKRSSEMNTHSTLNASCSHGLPKPEGRFCTRFFSPRQFYGNQFRISARRGRARHSVRAARSACRGLPALPNAKA